MSVTDYKELEGLLRIALFNDLAIQYWEKQLWTLVSTHSLTLYWRFFLFKNICAKPKVVHGREESSENSGVQTEERLNPGHQCSAYNSCTIRKVLSHLVGPISLFWPSQSLYMQIWIMDSQGGERKKRHSPKSLGNTCQRDRVPSINGMLCLIKVWENEGCTQSDLNIEENGMYSSTWGPFMVVSWEKEVTL